MSNEVANALAAGCLFAGANESQPNGAMRNRWGIAGMTRLAEGLYAFELIEPTKFNVVPPADQPGVPPFSSHGLYTQMLSIEAPYAVRATFVPTDLPPTPGLQPGGIQISVVAVEQDEDLNIVQTPTDDFLMWFFVMRFPYVEGV